MMLNKVYNKSASISSASKRFCSHEMRVIRNVDTAYLKRGTGGRSSFNGNVVTVFGATGFLGRYICNQLGKRGCQLIIPYRGDSSDSHLEALKLCGDLGQVLYQPYDLRDPLSIRKAIRYSNVVINLVGRVYETSNFSFYKVHVKGAKEIATACKEYNIERLIHFSALNVTPVAKKYYLLKYGFLPSKLQGEEAVLDVFPTATIFRPAAVFGTFDSFLWPLCERRRMKRLSIPLYAKGEKTIRQPVYASDVAKGVINALNDYDTRGKIYQAVGPERYYLKDIAIFCAQTLQRHLFNEKLIHDIKYDWTFPLKVLYFSNFLGAFHHYPVRNMLFEFIERESVTDIVDPDLPTLFDLGVPLTKFESLVPSFVFAHFKHQPAMSRTFTSYKYVDSLSQKAVSDYTF